MIRRRYLALSSAGAALVLTGCLGGDGGDDGPGGPRETIEGFVAAVDDADRERINQEYIHNEADMNEWSAEDAAAIDGVDVSLFEANISRDGDTATAEMVLSYGDGGSDTLKYELRVRDGEWWFWDRLNDSDGS